MALLEWSPTLSVDVPEMDAEHKRLIALVNDLNDAMKQGKGKTELDHVLHELVRYTQTHFASEERYLARIGYPGLVTQKAAHAGLVKQVTQFKADYDAGKSMITVRLLSFLSDWVRNHIQKSDKQYGVWAKQRVGA